MRDIDLDAGRNPYRTRGDAFRAAFPNWLALTLYLMAAGMIAAFTVLWLAPQIGWDWITKVGR